jgi:hypothetical protein
MPQVIQQKPRLGYGPQPSPERHVYIDAARKHHPTRHAWQLSHDEVRQIRAMFQSDAVLYTIAAHFSIPRREVGKVAKRPYMLRADVPAAFETPFQADMRMRWLSAEINEAHEEAIAQQVLLDWSEAKKENRRRDADRKKQGGADARH